MGAGTGRARNDPLRVRAVYASALQSLRAGTHRSGYAGIRRGADAGADSATAVYRQMVDEAAELAQNQKSRVDPMHHERIDQLLDTYARSQRPVAAST